MITLFGNLESGNVHKVQMILRRLVIAFERVDVSQVNDEPRRPEFLRLNPMGKVPVVRLDGGDVLSESGAILFFFAQRTPLWPTDPRSGAEVLRWMFFEQYSHEPSLAVLRYLRRFTEPSETSAKRIDELLVKAHRALAVLDERLEAQRWVAATSFTIADIALYPYTKWADEADVDLAPYPCIRRWLSAVEREPGFLPLRCDGATSSMAFDAYFGAALTTA